MSFINFSKSFLLLNSKKVPTHELDNATPNTNTIVESDTINVADDLISGTSTISPVDTSILETSTINTVDASILETSTNNTTNETTTKVGKTSHESLNEKVIKLSGENKFDEAIKLVLSEKNPDLKNAEAWNQLIIECADKGRSKMSIILFNEADRLLETTSKYSKQNSMHEDDLRMRKIYQGRWKTQDDESWPNTSSYMRNRPPTRYNPNKSFGRPPSPELSFDSSPSTGSYGNFRGQHNRGRPGGYRGVSRNYRNVGYRGPNYSNG
ncbi:18488_t:CDS:2 [Entrophospora sp. SA101]|nr:23435_t:CDS:2 [Entrophospora sp. SA101]CAJ0753755.1 18488_t:CDS:2 [Entrophospora sp. SA101]